MQREDFTPAAPGQVRQCLSGAAKYVAFIPAPLPPTLVWTPELASAISAADRALGTLAGVATTLPNPHLLIGPFKRIEAVLSSRIEGTHASLSELVLFEAAPQRASPHSDANEVLNYVRALDVALAPNQPLPLSLRLIREMHRILMAGVRGDERSPGEFRVSQNWIGPEGCTLNDATFVPPPPAELDTALADFERFLHTPSPLPPVVRLALIHYQFECIHPFLDGNGRIGRLLVPLILCHDKHLPAPLLYLSAFFERKRSEYYTRLRRTSTHGEWDEWIRFFALGIETQANDAVVRGRMLFSLRDTYRERLATPRASALLPKLVDMLFDQPWIDVAAAARHAGVTPVAAQRLIDRLVETGVLVEVTGWKRNRVYVAQELLRMTESGSLE